MYLQIIVGVDLKTAWFTITDKQHFRVIHSDVALSSVTACLRFQHKHTLNVKKQ